MNIRTTLLIVSLATMMLLAGCAPETPSEPSAPTSDTNVAGQAIGDATSPYASPISAVTLNPDPAQSRATASTTRVSTSDDWVYKTAYYLRDGYDSGWTAFSLTGTTHSASNKWIAGDAEGSIPIPPGISAPVEAAVGVYTCSDRADGTFDCHTERWQVYEFDIVQSTPADVTVRSFVTAGGEGDVPLTPEFKVQVDAVGTPAPTSYDFMIDFGDGTQSAWKTQNIANMGLVYDHEYTEANTYTATVKVRVDSSDTDFDTDTTTVVATEPAPSTPGEPGTIPDMTDPGTGDCEGLSPDECGPA